MKRSMTKILVGIVTLTVLAPAAFAEVFVVDHDKYEQSKIEKRQVAHDTRAKKVQQPGYKKGVYSGSSGYTGRIAGQMATRKVDKNGKTSIVVSPVRGSQQEFNTSLRYGDMTQSREARLNHSFNN